MAYNPTVKRYNKDLGVAIPNVRFCPTEFPRLNTTPAPYLPLRLHNERHDEYYTILTGKVIALDSLGFVVPAGLGVQLELALNELALQGTWNDATLGNLDRYDATDVAEGVVNARGVAATLNEPVVRAFITDVVVAGGEDLATGDVPASNNPLSIGEHIGVAPYSFLRAASDVMARAVDENELHPAAASGVEATFPFDPTQHRHLAWELQNRVTALVAAECLLYPVVENLNNLLIEGQAVAVGATMAAFGHGSKVTYDEASNIVPVAAAAVAFTSRLPDFDAAGADAAIAVAMLALTDRIVGQVVRKNTRFPSSYLDHVATRWDSSVPGFQAIDRMPGSATSGYPWHMHTAGATLGEIQISPLMR